LFHEGGDIVAQVGRALAGLLHSQQTSLSDVESWKKQDEE
jgi:hypothetical protein